MATQRSKESGLRFYSDGHRPIRKEDYFSGAEELLDDWVPMGEHNIPYDPMTMSAIIQRLSRTPAQEALAIENDLHFTIKAIKSTSRKPFDSQKALLGWKNHFARRLKGLSERIEDLPHDRQAKLKVLLKAALEAVVDVIERNPSKR